MNDQELLREYLDAGSERAFQSLVQRHLDLVYSTALRRIGDAGLAEEVTQNVFVALARKAPFLSRDVALAAWLHKTTLLEARHRLRGELRRKRREETAIAMSTTLKEQDSLLKSLSPVLDEALMELRENERHAVLLRFFENKALREVGEALGVGEDAAQKRVAKALEQLTRAFRRRGYTVPAATAIGAALQGVTQTAPAALASVAAQTALQSARAASSGGLGWLIAKFMGLTKTQTASLCLLVGAMPVAYECTALSEAKSEQQNWQVRLDGLRQSLAERQGEQEQIQRRLRVANNTLAFLESEQSRTRALNTSVPAGDDPNLYRWSDASEYVRLPKTFFTRIQIYDPAMDSRKRKEPKFSPALAKDGRVSLLLLETLGLDDLASAWVQQAFADFAQAYRELEQSHTLLTHTLPEGFHVEKPYQTLVTSAFPEEGKLLEIRLRTLVEQALGNERADALWKRLSGSFDQFNHFGSRARTLVLHFDKNDSILITHPDEGSWTRLVAPDEVPEEFKPFLEQWKSSRRD
jgi:RNA polymerase sigma factor (sigma-70 family)